MMRTANDYCLNMASNGDHPRRSAVELSSRPPRVTSGHLEAVAVAVEAVLARAAEHAT
jgi:hypothetical protein